MAEETQRTEAVKERQQDCFKDNIAQETGGAHIALRGQLRRKNRSSTEWDLLIPDLEKQMCPQMTVIPVVKLFY